MRKKGIIKRLEYLEKRLDTRYLIRMIMDYLGITIRDRDKYKIIKKDKKDE